MDGGTSTGSEHGKRGRPVTDPEGVFVVRGRTVPRTCPACRVRLDAATGVALEGDLGEPGPGDVSICVECETWLVLEVSGFRIATAREIERVDPVLRDLMLGGLEALHASTRRPAH